MDDWKDILFIILASYVLSPPIAKLLIIIYRKIMQLVTKNNSNF